MEKSRAIELLKLAVPIKALTQQEYSDFIEAVNMAIDALKQPEPKEGHWIEGKIYRDVIECYCSECGQIMTTAATVRMNYCPNCGARMKGATT